MKRYFIYYCILIALVLLLAPPMKRAVEPYKTRSGVVHCNTSAFKEGNLIIMDKDGNLRGVMACDTTKQKLIGIVTKVDKDGEILIKYEK